MDLGIKWMNALLLNDRKVGGILTETRLASNGEARAAASSPFVSSLVIGVGLNLYESGSAFPSDLASIAGAIFSGSAPERERLDALRLQIAAGVWAAFTPLYYEILHAEEGRPPAGFVEAYREASVILGRSLDYEASPGAEKLQGVCVEIDERCRPVLRLPDDGQICVESGRLFLRAQQPQPGAEQT